MFHGFDGLMTLSRREGVDIRPTLLRVLTDLYVQAPTHTRDEERQFIELASRLIDEVDDATRAVVAARLSTYPATPPSLAAKLRLRAPQPHDFAPPLPEPAIDAALAPEEPAPPAAPEPLPPMPPAAPAAAPTLAMKPDDASELIAMFAAAGSSERARILQNLASAPLKPSARPDPRRAARAVASLERAALAGDSVAFTTELADAALLTSRVAAQIVGDVGGEPLACVLKALGMTADAYQRVLLFLDPVRGASVLEVFRLARLYDSIDERAALILLAAWRGAPLAATRAKHRPALYDDERHRARPAAAQQPRPAAPGAPAVFGKASRPT